MKASLKNIRLGIPIVVAVVLLSSCLFPEVIDVSISGNEEEGFVISASTNADVSLCVQESEANEFTCLYAGEAGEAITSNVILTGVDIPFLRILDPLIIQLPDTATNFAGSFLHNGMSGNLVVTSGLTSFNADLDTTITAEPGTQFVILDLPDDGAPMTGSFAFNVNFALPPGTASLQLKPLFTGKVVANGQTFFPPLLPCVADFANIPALNVPFPAGGSVPIPRGQVQGCDNVVYNFGPDGMPMDSDGDGILDDDDACPGTMIPESVPTNSLGVNRFALLDGDTSFDTTAPQGRGPRKAFTLENTAGCSCEQIIAQLGLGAGHTKFGCSISAMEEWIDLVHQ